MTVVLGQLRAPQQHGAMRGGDSHRRTAVVVLKSAGTADCTAFCEMPTVADYAGSDGNTYTDTLPVRTPALVWTPYVDPHPDPADPLHNPHPPTDYEHTLAVAHAVLGADAATYKLFWPAMYGGTVAAILAARSCDFNTVAEDLASLVPALVPANTAGDVVRAIHVNAHFPRPSQGGCNACDGDPSVRIVQLVAGTPTIGDPHAGSGGPPTPPADYVPLPGYNGDGGPATAAQLDTPLSLWKQGKTVYIGCHGSVRAVTSATITTVAGNGMVGHVDGVATGVGRVHNVDAVIVDAAGTLWLADNNDLAVGGTGPVDFIEGTGGIIDFTWSPPPEPGLRSVSLTDIVPAITTYPRTWTRPGWQDSFLGVSLSIYSMDTPCGLAITTAGTIYQTYNMTGTILSLGTSGDGTFTLYTLRMSRLDVVTTSPIVELLWDWAVRGPGASGGAAHFGYDLNLPQGAWLVNDQLLYVADAGNNQVFTYDLTTHAITVIAGAADRTAGYNGDTRLATTAQLNHPSGVAVDGRGNVLIADTNNHCIRRVTTDGRIHTVMGVPGHAGFGLWDPVAGAVVPDSGLKLGRGAVTLLNAPRSVFVTKRCSLLVTDTQNHRVLGIFCPGMP